MQAFLAKVILLVYWLATVFFILYIVFQKNRFYKMGLWTIFFGFMCHTIILIQNTISHGYLPVVDLKQAIFFWAWVLVGVFLIFQFRFNLKVIGAFLSPLASIMILTSSFLPAKTRAVSPLVKNLWLSFHIAFIFLGQAILAMAFVVSIMYLLQEREIKQKHLGAMSVRLPSLSTLDQLNHYCIIYGFPLLTIGMISGSIYAQFTLGSYWRWDPKEVWSLITWLVYAILVHERLTVGWRGRRAAIMAIIGFGVMLFSLLGVGIFLKGYHSFSSFQKP